LNTATQINTGRKNRLYVNLISSANMIIARRDTFINTLETSV